MELKAGVVCDRGLNPRRPVNEDRYLAIAERGLFAVFDGVGGQRAGEVASQTAAETIEEALTHDSAESSEELIRRAIQFANRDIFEMAESDSSLKTMATTVALLHIEGDRATIAHVGDSRVYRLENGRFYRETIDHTDLNDDIRAGRVASDKAAEAEQRNVINRALGVEPDVDVEIKTIKARDGARFLLCSDGIYRHMSDEEIARVLAENKDPQRAADELKRIVHERGADDNLTAVVVQIGRARQTAVLAIEDGLPGQQNRAVGAQAAEASTAQAAARGGRIQVEFGRQRRARAADVNDEATRQLDRQATRARASLAGAQASVPSSRKIIWALAALVVVAAAFYAGLRASDFVSRQASDGDAVSPGPFQIGREAFERGDYQTARAQFESLLSREPQNADARYWLGRAQLEQRDFTGAAKSFEEAIANEPAKLDAYIQAAAAYEAMGERAKAAQMLARYSEERRKQAANANSVGR
ncbi:MAG TPA: protein phosphatase 2C domain-containing protein [Blastocatellia bacterium]|nr:protein phosphatase 2C domain-containing protein [Blastocatellia bacterium]